jgi:hypothetical protein
MCLRRRLDVVASELQAIPVAVVDSVNAEKTVWTPPQRAENIS